MAGRITKVAIFALLLAFVAWIFSRQNVAVDPFDED